MDQTLAAIDIGSNTVHLIVAATDGTHLTILADESIFVRLADGVWNLGYIPDERILTTAQAIYHLRGVARSFGAARVVVVATEVARTARNTSALLSAVQAVTGLEPLVLSGMDEAMLTFQGVTHQRRLPSSVAVADLGGGSLEVILAELGYSAWRTSLPLGSAFMHDRFVTSDPPQAEEIQALRAYLAEKLIAVPHLERVEALIICGGTVNALMRLVRSIEGRAMGDTVLRQQDLHTALAAMLRQPYEIIAADYRLRMERARLLPTGAVILDALLDHLRLPGMIVSQAGIREGIILAVAQHSDGWLEGARAESSRPYTSEPTVHLAPPPPTPSLALPPIAWEAAGEVAWVKIHALIKALLPYRRKVLAGDADAIHDMRVTARRLRTALETFAPCFPVQPYRRLLRAVKRLAQALGAVRDHDVALHNLRTRLHSAPPDHVPGLRSLISRHLSGRRRGREQLRSRLRSRSLERFLRYGDALRLKDDQMISPQVVRGPVMNPEPVEETLR